MLECGVDVSLLLVVKSTYSSWEIYVHVSAELNPNPSQWVLDSKSVYCHQERYCMSLQKNNLVQAVIEYTAARGEVQVGLP